MKNEIKFLKKHNFLNKNILYYNTYSTYYNTLLIIVKNIFGLSK